MTRDKFDSLKAGFEGELFYKDSSADNAQLLIYSTDASVYREKPLAVAIPASIADIRRLIHFATQNGLTLIPRAAGTSLAGQVVGSGIITDISKHFNQVVEVNKEEKWVRVQPGVIRDDLNHYLRPYGLMFGPETSTSSRAMIGGMLGNNSCGLHSIVWGSVRDYVLEIKGLLSDGSEATFREEELLPNDDAGLKRNIYQSLFSLLDDEKNKALIREKFPKRDVVRRNSGYALDSILAMHPFSPGDAPFNLCKLIAGSEGTLMVATEIKLRLLDLPPAETALVCLHCNTLQQALEANTIALRYHPAASELVDKFILDFTTAHPVYQQNRFFIEGDPAAILMVEFFADTKEDIEAIIDPFIREVTGSGCSYAAPVLYNGQTNKAWDIRKAGLGLLRNLPGDAQPVNLIEDCAVAPADLANYARDIQALLARHNVSAAYYAHAGAGELHIEPILNLKSPEGLTLFRTLLKETVEIVKKYSGSLSGEHGDGRLRGEAIVWAMGDEVYRLFTEVKKIFDPRGVFNKGKIVDTPPMDENLRVMPGEQPALIKTWFDFSEQGGILRLAEKCSGSGDCRRSHLSSGTMCPSFMATRNEKDTTRARANILREFLSNEADSEPFDHEEIKEVMDLCLGCKGCKSECPSKVDITKMKAEFLQQYYDRHGVPARARRIGNFSRQMWLASRFRPLYNLVFGTRLSRQMVNHVVGFHPQRSIPLLPAFTLQQWFRNRKKQKNNQGRQVFFFCDEFTNYYDAVIGRQAILLLEKLGYRVVMPAHLESGRTFLSKGMVKKAAEIANRNIALLSACVTEDCPLIGIEPSALLTIRDEYIDLAQKDLHAKAKRLSANTFTIEEFIAQEYFKGHIRKDLFTREKKRVLLHGHCYQKVLSDLQHSKIMLSLPENYEVEIIPTGCCGMAGAFGYEKEHFAVSLQVAELVLLPAVRKADMNSIIAASGTSCRHQIKDGAGRISLHPVEVLWQALAEETGL